LEKFIGSVVSIATHHTSLYGILEWALGLFRHFESNAIISLAPAGRNIPSETTGKKTEPRGGDM
jgi:hypothetical protein